MIRCPPLTNMLCVIVISSVEATHRVQVCQCPESHLHSKTMPQAAEDILASLRGSGAGIHGGAEGAGERGIDRYMDERLSALCAQRGSQFDAFVAREREVEVERLREREVNVSGDFGRFGRGMLWPEHGEKQTGVVGSVHNSRDSMPAADKYAGTRAEGKRVGRAESWGRERDTDNA